MRHQIYTPYEHQIKNTDEVYGRRATTAERFYHIVSSTAAFLACMAVLVVWGLG